MGNAQAKGRAMNEGDSRMYWGMKPIKSAHLSLDDGTQAKGHDMTIPEVSIYVPPEPVEVKFKLIDDQAKAHAAAVLIWARRKAREEGIDPSKVTLGAALFYAAAEVTKRDNLAPVLGG